MALVKSNIPWAIKLDNYPEQSNVLTYNTFAQSPTWKNFETDKVEIVGGTNSEINAGTYYRLFKPLRKYVFPNGTKKIYSAPWVINRAAGKVTLSETSGEVKIKFTRTFTVSRLGDGVISATSSNNRIATVSVDGNKVTITGVSVGDVTITVNVAQGTNYLATSATYACQSRKTQIKIPTVTNTVKTFTSYSQSPTITNAPSTSLVERTGTVSATNYSASAYKFTYAIKDTDAYEWDDGTISNKTFSWQINKAVFPLPAQTGTAYYNKGNSVTPSWNFGTTNLIEITNGSATTVGKYTASFHLRDTVNCQWSDGSIDDKSADFYISKALVTVPSQSNYMTWEWGTWFYPSWYDYDSSLMSLGGTTETTNAGNFYAIFTLNDSANYIWSDGTTSASHTVMWTVEKKGITRPSFDWWTFTSTKSRDADGTSTVIANEIYNFDSTYMSYSTNEVYNPISALGNHDFKISLADKNNCYWIDSNDNSTLSFRYTINAKYNSASLNNGEYWFKRTYYYANDEMNKWYVILTFDTPEDYTGTITDTWDIDTVGEVEVFAHIVGHNGTHHEIRIYPMASYHNRYVNEEVDNRIKVTIKLNSDGRYAEKTLTSEQVTFRADYSNML